MSQSRTVGKTKLLYEWASRLDERQEDVEIRFLSDAVELTAENAPEHPLGPCVIIVDDAHHTDLDLRPLLERLRASDTKLQIVLATRSHARNRLKREAIQAGTDARTIETIELTALDREAHQELARRALGEELQHLSIELAQTTRDSPLMTTIGASLIRSGTVSPASLDDEEAFREEIVARFEDERLGRIPETTDADTVRDVLDVLALIGTLKPEIDIEVETTAEFLDIEPYRLRRLVDELEDAGLLVRRGRYVRIAPDILADHLSREACLTTQGQPSGFGERVRRHFWETHGVSIMETLARLDHDARRRHGESAGLLDDAWQQIQAMVDTAEPREKAAILSALRRLAPYQPEAVLTLVRQARETIAWEEMEPMVGARLRDRLSDLLVGVGHHIDRVPRCLRILWELAEDDDRAPNRHPSSPLRAMETLTEWRPRKPTDFQVAVAKALAGMAERDANLQRDPSILEQTEPLLAKVGSDDVYDGAALHMRAVPIPAETARPVVEQVLTMLEDRLDHEDPYVRGKALEALGAALRAPMPMYGMELPEAFQEAWTPLRLEAFEPIATTAREDPNPVVRIKALNQVRSDAVHRPETAIGEQAASLFTELDVSLELRTADALVNPYKRDHPTSLQGREGARDAWRQMTPELAETYAERCDDPDTCAEQLTEWLVTAQLLDMRPSPKPFLSELLPLVPEIVRSLVDRNRSDPDVPVLREVLVSSVRSLSTQNPMEAVALGEDLLAEDEPRLLEAFAIAYMQWDEAAERTTDQERELLARLADHEDPSLRLAGFRSQIALAGDDEETVQAQIHAFDLEGAEEGAGTFLDALFGWGPLDQSDLDGTTVELILTKLDALSQLSDSAIEYFLEEAAEQHPSRVARFLVDRARRAVQQEDVQIGLLFHRSSPFGALREQDDWPAILREVRDLVEEEPARAVLLRRLFATLSLGYEPVALDVLEEWLEEPTEDRLHAVTILLGEAPKDVFFEHLAFLRRLLETIETQPRELRDELRSRLLFAPLQGTRSRAIGEPAQEDIELQERALDVADELEGDDPLQAWYVDLADEVEARTAWEAMRDEEHLDAHRG